MPLIPGCFRLSSITYNITLNERFPGALCKNYARVLRPSASVADLFYIHAVVFPLCRTEEKTRNGILRTPSVNPPRKQRMSLKQRSVTYVKSFIRAFTREKRYPTCFKFRFVSSPLRGVGSWSAPSLGWATTVAWLGTTKSVLARRISRFGGQSSTDFLRNGAYGWHVKEVWPDRTASK